MNKFIYRIHTIHPIGYYYTIDDDIARHAYNLGATINCGRITDEKK